MRVPAILITILFALSPAAPGSEAGYAVEVRQDDPISWWRFKPADGAARIEDAAGRHPAAVRGALRLSAGPAGEGSGAGEFDGRGACLEIPHHRDFELEALSVEFWLRSEQAWDRPVWPGSATFVTKATANAGSSDWTINAGTRAAGRGPGLLVASSGAASAPSDARTSSRGRRNDGRWHHVVWTRAADGDNRLYVDGRLEDRALDGGGSIVNRRPIQVGGDPLEGGSWYEGRLAEVAIYGKALEPERVRAHFLAARPADGPAPPAVAAPPEVRETLSLENGAGLRWEPARTDAGWALGAISLRGKPVESPGRSGLLCLRHRESGEERWIPAQQGGRTGPRAARFSGEHRVDGAQFRFAVELALDESLPAASFEARWSVDRELPGWDVCLSYHEGFSREWRAHCYPFAADAVQADIEPLRYCGVPGALLHRPDLSLVVLFAIDPRSDYLDPRSWTGATCFRFKDAIAPPRFEAGGGRLLPGTEYALPLQVLFSDGGSFAPAISSLVLGWIELNRYEVQPLQVRAPDEALAIFAEGRRRTRMWNPGKGYRIQDAWAVIYMPESPGNAYLDYRLFEETGDPLWRERAFETMDFFLKAQRSDPADPQYGAVESHFDLEPGRFASTDRGGNPGLKPDMNAMAARYALMLWKRLKDREGLDRKDWYAAAVRIADWILRRQNPDGGLPQVVGSPHPGRGFSVVSGRTLVAFPTIHRITGDGRYGAFALQLEGFARRSAEGRLRFTGAHTDLPPGDLEADSIWQVVEYWLDKRERTGDAEALAHAEAGALLAFLMMCPKQLPWVKNPTQTCHAEQQHYLQYSNYCYTNAKIACLRRLGAAAGKKLYLDLAERAMQCGFWAQETSGDWMGCQYERLCDPWHGVSRDYDSKGTLYMSELAVEQALQLLELGLAGSKLRGVRR